MLTTTSDIFNPSHFFFMHDNKIINQYKCVFCYNCIALQVNIIRIYRQLEYFQEYQQRVSGLIGSEQTARLVNGALVLITLGGNDFVNNYYLVPFSARSRQYNLPDYVKYIISEYKKILRVIPSYILSSISSINFLD